MHHIYHTEGILLSSKNFGEAGKHYHILTRDLGLVVASAQGVRKMESKLRYVLQVGSYVNIDLVRAKDFWKITTASKKNELEDLIKDKNKFSIFLNISRLLKRLLQGEDENEKLFLDFKRSLNVLEKSKSDEESNIEVMIVLRILYHLGYIGGGEEIKYFTSSPIAEDLIFEISKKRSRVLKEINKALRETQL